LSYKNFQHHSSATTLQEPHAIYTAATLNPSPVVPTTQVFLYNPYPIQCATLPLCYELHHTASLCDLSLRLLGHITRLDDNWDLGQTALAEDF